MTATLSTGPDLDNEERGVHIIFVPDDAVPCLSHADPTAAELQQVATHIGEPQPTDVIVFCGRPWHFAGGALRKHPEVHKLFPMTILKLYRQTHDRAAWWSEREFQITAIEKEDLKHDGTAVYPFSQMPEARAATVANGTIWVARSTVPVDAAYGQEYKITFVMDGKTIDPNMDCVGN
jgi:hypothetical protein